MLAARRADGPMIGRWANLGSRSGIVLKVQTLHDALHSVARQHCTHTVTRVIGVSDQVSVTVTAY